MLRILLIFLALFPMIITQKGYAQQFHREIYSTWEEFLEHYTDEEVVTSDEIENLSFLKDHPININTADKETLLQLPFLSETQIDSLLKYRTMKEKFLTLGELQFISGWDAPTRRFTSLFTYVGEEQLHKETLKETLLRGNHVVDTRFDIPTYQRKGEKMKPGGYLGDGIKNLTRYRYSKSNVKYGVTLEKDAGEPFAKQGNNPYDYYSFYFSYNTRNQKHRYVVGDFKLHIGEGLTIGKNIFSGQLGLLNSTSRQLVQLQPHTGTDEHLYFRGLAYTYRISKFRITSFASYRKLDAKIENNKAVTLYTDGVHRTYKELKHKAVLGNLTFGTYLEYPTRNIQWGVGGYVTHYDKVVFPQPRLYNKYAFHGDFTTGGSLTYAHRGHRRIRFSGELSVDEKLHFAFSHHTIYKVSEDLKLSSQIRLFSERYNSPFANTITYSSKVRNEQAVMLGATWNAFKSWKLETYVDAHRFPFSTYRTDGPSHGLKTYLQATHASTKSYTNTLRYTYNLWQRNYTTKQKQLIYEGKHRVRLQHIRKFLKGEVTGMTEVAVTHSQVENSNYGIAFAIRGNYRPMPTFTNSLFGSLFFTDNYESAVYAYEPLKSGMYSFGALYYKGFRIVMQSKYEWKERFTLGVRYGLTHYFNKDNISSDLQEINSSYKGDFSVYLKLKL